MALSIDSSSSLQKFLERQTTYHHNGTILVSNKECQMPTITLKNIPESLYEQLKAAANIHRRSLNSEILFCVERTLGTHKIDVSEHLKVARNLRRKTAHSSIDDKMLSDAKVEGRL